MNKKSVNAVKMCNVPSGGLCPQPAHAVWGSCCRGSAMFLCSRASC